MASKAEKAVKERQEAGRIAGENELPQRTVVERAPLRAEGTREAIDPAHALEQEGVSVKDVGGVEAGDDDGEEAQDDPAAAGAGSEPAADPAATESTPREAFDPEGKTIDEVEAYLGLNDGDERASKEEIQRVRDLEESGKARSTLLKTLDEALAEG